MQRLVQLLIVIGGFTAKAELAYECYEGYSETYSFLNEKQYRRCNDCYDCQAFEILCFNSEYYERDFQIWLEWTLEVKTWKEAFDCFSCECNIWTDNKTWKGYMEDLYD